METSMIKFFLFYMAEIMKSELVYDTQTNSYFKIENRYDDGEILASPISGGTESVMLKLKNCITAESLDFGENNPFLTRNTPVGNPQLTRNSLAGDPKTTRKQPDTNPQGEYDAPEYLGKHGYFFPKIATEQPLHLQKLCSEVERLLHRKIIETSRHQSLKTAKNDYKEYAQILKSKTPEMLNNLERLKTKLVTDLKRSKIGTRVEEETSERKRTYTKLKQTAGTIFLLFIIGGVIYFGAGGTWTHPPYSARQKKLFPMKIRPTPNLPNTTNALPKSKKRKDLQKKTFLEKNIRIPNLMRKLPNTLKPRT